MTILVVIILLIPGLKWLGIIADLFHNIFYIFSNISWNIIKQPVNNPFAIPVCVSEWVSVEMPDMENLQYH